MASGAVPFLTFQPGRGHGAAEAMEVYTSLFADGAVSRRAFAA